VFCDSVNDDDDHARAEYEQGTTAGRARSAIPMIILSCAARIAMMMMIILSSAALRTARVV